MNQRIASWAVFCGRRSALMLRLAALVLLLLAHPRSQAFYLLGLLAACAGQWLRFWTAGHAAPQAKGAPAAGGPYACLRRPMETGSLLMLSGFALMCSSFARWGSTLLVWVVFAAILCRRLFPFVPEEGRLRAQAWRAAASEFLPVARRLRAAWENGRYDPALARAAGERDVLRLAAIVAVFLRFKLAYRL